MKFTLCANPVAVSRPVYLYSLSISDRTIHTCIAFHSLCPPISFLSFLPLSSEARVTILRWWLLPDGMLCVHLLEEDACTSTACDHCMLLPCNVISPIKGLLWPLRVCSLYSPHNCAKTSCSICALFCKWCACGIYIVYWI